MDAKMPSVAALVKSLEISPGLKLRLKPTPTKTATTQATTALTKPAALRTRADFQIKLKIEFGVEFDLEICTKYSENRLKRLQHKAFSDFT